MELWERGNSISTRPSKITARRFHRNPGPSPRVKVMGHLAGIRHYKTGPDDLEIATPGTSRIRFRRASTSSRTILFVGTGQAVSLLDPGLHGGRLRHRRRLWRKYVDFVRQNVFVPAGMEHTQVDDRFAIIPYRTRFIRRRIWRCEERRLPRLQLQDSRRRLVIVSGRHGKIRSGNLNDKLIKRATRDVMWTAGKPSDGTKIGYASGWGNEDQEAFAIVGHTGGQQGTSTALLIAPAQGAAVVVLANMEGLNPNDLAVEILKVLVGAMGGTLKK